MPSIRKIADMGLLQVRDLSVRFQTSDGMVEAVNNISFKIDEGGTLAIVGESGSGKSQSVFALTGLLAENGSATGSVHFNGQEILNLPESDLNRIRAAKISMIFQDPMTSLNPYMKVSAQLTEVLIQHQGMSKRAALAESIRMLDAVQIPDARKRIHHYPHEYSGGMRQRVMIAMALLCQPRLLIADEPTTALDVTIQAQIMALLRDMQKTFNTAMILITHDLGVVAGACDDTLVMYAGRVMEYGPTEALFATPSHPYTQGLLAAIPRLDQGGEQLKTIPGNPPNMMNMPAGCPFCERCAYAIERCAIETPVLRPNDQSGAIHKRACHLAAEAIR